jgi:intergrase/recombinase
MARTNSKEHPMPPEGCWIKYQLDLRNIKLEEVAQKAHRSVSMVSRVICGVKKSEKVEKALAQMLGYATYQNLMEAASRGQEGGAA